ncbi:MAG: s-methyl-5-thioribose-1-phosphate isomerase [Anaerolineales bacterium]|nr:s-methyl-5-thioribose-1-phosphate isomerase [Anaerolineales bacterium]MCB8953304.1 s-methyl-5-thioribose-1-phosphate isomerase [Ardenticatenales bacterium]
MNLPPPPAPEQTRDCPALLSDRFKTLYYDTASHEVVLLDRRKYPFQVVYERYNSVEGVAVAIEEMVVQGGPPLAYAAGLGLVLAAREVDETGDADYRPRLEAAAQRLRHTRPTADDLHHLIPLARQTALDAPPGSRAAATLAAVNGEIQRGNDVSRRCGWYAAQLLGDGDRVLTHCIAGAALCWMLWYAKLAGKRIHLFPSETRPYFQGARLTAQSCVEMGIDCTLITDGMSAHLMSQGRLDKFICAADRLTLDGHITNKVGTLQHAIAAHYFGLPFYVLGYDGPDPHSPTAADIIIEERDPRRIFEARGREGVVRTAVEGINGAYPAFDITPPHLIAAVVTDRGVFPPTLLRYYFQVE